jgi:hypothetical protein
MLEVFPEHARKYGEDAEAVVVVTEGQTSEKSRMICDCIEGVGQISELDPIGVIEGRLKHLLAREQGMTRIGVSLHQQGLPNRSEHPTGPKPGLRS